MSSLQPNSKAVAGPKKGQGGRSKGSRKQRNRSGGATNLLQAEFADNSAPPMPGFISPPGKTPESSSRRAENPEQLSGRKKGGDWGRRMSEPAEPKQRIRSELTASDSGFRRYTVAPVAHSNESFRLNSPGMVFRLLLDDSPSRETPDSVSDAAQMPEIASEPRASTPAVSSICFVCILLSKLVRI